MEYEYLKRWTRPDYYMGETPYDYYVAYGSHRDSDILTLSNFDCILKALGGEDGYLQGEEYIETVRIQRSRHFLVGWLDIILVHESAVDKLDIAEELLASIAEYPALDDEDLSSREWEYAQEVWECIRLSEKIEHCQRSDISIFAARSDDFPSECLESLAVDAY